TSKRQDPRITPTGPPCLSTILSSRKVMTTGFPPRLALRPGKVRKQRRLPPRDRNRHRPTGNERDTLRTSGKRLSRRPWPTMQSEASANKREVVEALLDRLVRRLEELDGTSPEADDALLAALVLREELGERD